MRQTLLAMVAIIVAISCYSQTPVYNAKKVTSTIIIDGNPNESAWEVTTTAAKPIVGTPNNVVKFGALWNTQYLYVAYIVTDANLYNDSQNDWDDDGIELYIDADNNGGTSYGTNDRQFMKGWNSTSISEKSNKTTGVLHAWTVMTGGYRVELAIPWSNFGISNPAANLRIGFDIAVNDDDNGQQRESQLMWAGDNDNWRYPRNFGDLLLVDLDTQAPSAPTNLTASNITQTSLSLTWTASTDNVSVAGYDIYQENVKINASPVTVTNYTVTGLTPATAYSFYAVARDAAGNVSENSSTVNPTTQSPDTEAPSAPTDLVASSISYNSFDLSWTASTDNIGVTGYNVFVNGNMVNGSLVTGTTYTVTGLTELTIYTAYVVALDQAGNNTAGSSIQVTTTEAPDMQAPTAPSGLSAAAITGTSLILNWTASTDNVGVAGYDVYRNNVKINTGLVTGTSYNVTGLTNATSYSFYVKALDDAGNASANSNTLNVTTPDTQSPSAPSNLAASAVTSATLTLTWSAAVDNVAVTGYDVYQNNNKINVSPVTGLSYNVTGLTASSTYSFYVQARDAAGNISANSNSINVTTPAASVCSGTGAINFQRFNNITGTSVANLTSNASYPNSPTGSGTLASFEIPSNVYDNYGMRVYGYICPPVTGSYTFWIASDDNSELWLSSTSSSANKQRIAYHVQWTTSREWNKYATQKSAAITLMAGQLYYVEALMKDGTQGDNMAVGWAKPGQATTVPSEVIPGSSLIAVAPDNQAPSAPGNLTASNITQSTIMLNWAASTDNFAVTGYDVYRDGVKINASNVTGTSYTATGLTPFTAYAFYVKAKDGAGNVSANSNTVNAITLQTQPGLETFTQRTVISSQRMPHDLVYGPDNNLWYTERFAGRVNFVVPATGVKTTVLTLGSKLVKVGGQDGLMGLALHPDFLNGKPYVYISYTYQSISNTVRRMRIERFTYNFSTKVLESPVTVMENIPGSNDHNSARLAIGPDLKLYFSVGDMGAGQFDNAGRTNNAQNLNVNEGKILRLNTELIAGSWIPTDNPYSNAGLKTAVYSFGHRNPQGLVWGNVNGSNILYSSEHGPYSDDEINAIEMGRNYGWPQVSGFCDGNYNGRTIGGFAVVNEQNNCATLNAKQPLRSIYPAANPPQEGTDNLTWPSMAPSGTEFYRSNAIPGWQNSLLVTMLKGGTITRFKLSNDGQSIISDTINYFRGKGRFRDVVVSADGLKIYVACDSSGATSGPTGGITSTPANPGSILEFTYTGPSMRSANDLITSGNTIQENTGDRTLDVYPNPARAFVIVYNYRAGTNRVIQIVDMNGRVLRKQLSSSMATRIETGALANGIYLLKVTDERGKLIRTEKLLVRN
jgi:glucose/arabinose dehydrogenase/chitodextrinase